MFAAVSRPAWGRGRSPFYRPSENFHICSLERRHLASVTIAVGLVSLLLVVFAYHGGYGVGSWFYSFLVVVVGLAFVILGPMLLCRYLIYSLQNRSTTVSALSGNLTSSRVESGGNHHHRHNRTRPAHVYACIIIAPEPYTNERYLSSTQISDLPTYDECVTPLDGCSSDCGDCSTELWSFPSCQNDSDMPPPSYSEALARMNVP